MPEGDPTYVPAGRATQGTKAAVIHDFPSSLCHNNHPPPSIHGKTERTSHKSSTTSKADATTPQRQSYMA